jgi:hypothetical protein
VVTPLMVGTTDVGTFAVSSTVFVPTVVLPLFVMQRIVTVPLVAFGILDARSGTVHEYEVPTPVAMLVQEPPANAYARSCVKELLALGVFIVTLLPMFTLELLTAGCVALGIVFSVTVWEAVIVLYLVPEIVASMLNVTDSVTDFVPSALCVMVPLVMVASLVVLPPLLLIAGDVQVRDVPAMLAVLSVLLDMFKLQLDACTRYATQVTFEVFADTFCVADQSTRSLYLPDRIEPEKLPLSAMLSPHLHEREVAILAR